MHIAHVVAASMKLRPRPAGVLAYLLAATRPAGDRRGWCPCPGHGTATWPAAGGISPGRSPAGHAGRCEGGGHPAVVCGAHPDDHDEARCAGKH
jgi:hypothetical protein